MLDSIPASAPLELRDRAMFEVAYGAGLRAEELVNLDVTDLDPDAEEMRVTGKGSKTRVVPAGEPAWNAIERYLDRARPKLARDLRDGRRARARAVPLEERPAAVDLGRAAAAEGRPRSAPAPVLA